MLSAGFRHHDFEQIDPIRRRDFSDTIRFVSRAKFLFASAIFERENGSHPLKDSALIEIMIILSDLLCKCEKYAVRIDDKHDIFMSVENKKLDMDLTDLVRSIRNALCHIGSPEKYYSKSVQSILIGTLYGKGVLAITPIEKFEAEYSDDVAFFVGAYRIYLKRHMVFMLNRAEQLLFPIILQEHKYFADNIKNPV